MPTPISDPRGTGFGPAVIGLLVSLLLVMAAHPAMARYPHDTARPISRIGFGSGNKHDRPQPHWEALAKCGVDLWLWLGDNIYADTEDMAVMAEKYDAQFNRPDYAAFRRAVDIIGVWDDHDFGENKSGEWYPKKRESQQLLLDFLEVPDESPRRSREGAHGAHVFGPPGRQVKLILLDNRYFADEPGPEADILGAAQWQFLDHELRSSTAQLTFICSGTQIIPVDHKYEKWANFPRSRERLIAAIRESGRGGVVLLSGDRHIHELSLLNDETVNYPLIDFTASGMTHSYSSLKAERNRYRVGRLYKEKGFGLIDIDWSAEDPVVSFQARDVENRTRLRFDIGLSALQPAKDLEGAE